MSQIASLPVRKAVRTVSPTWEPITLGEAKKQCEVEGITRHDEHLSRIIAIARETLEADTGIVFATSTWTYKLDCWPSESIELPLRPVASISLISYQNASDVATTWSAANYSLDTSRTMPVILKGRSVDWPTLYDTWNPITITLVAGYSAIGSVPALAKSAMLLLIANMFEDRGDMPDSDQQSYERIVLRLMRSSYP